MSGAAARAERGTDAWREVVDGLRGSNDHSVFYALGAELDATLRALETVTQTLTIQVTRYARTLHLYDDSGSVDPHQRIAEAVDSLKQLAAALGEAKRHAGTYWGSIGHIGVGPDR